MGILVTPSPTCGVPVNPQAVALSNVAATVPNAIQKVYYTLHSTTPAFFTVNGDTPIADGNVCFFIDRGASIDLYANPGTVVKAISADATTGTLYVTEWQVGV